MSYTARASGRESVLKPLGIMLPKFGAIGLKFGPKLLKLSLAIASFGGYAYMFTWKFAVLIIFALVIHEYGHMRQMHRYGIRTRGFYLIPFVGGVIVPESAFLSRKEEFNIAFGGPWFGLMSAMVPLGIYLYLRTAVAGITAAACAGIDCTGTITHLNAVSSWDWYTVWAFSNFGPLMAGCAAWICLLNLINMFPVSPLDGGRMVKSIVFSLNSRLGLFVMAGALMALGALAIYVRALMVFLILIFGFFELANEWRRATGTRLSAGRYLAGIRNRLTGRTYAPPPTEKPKARTQVIPLTSMGHNDRILCTLRYIGLIVALVGVMVAVSHVPGADGALAAIRD